VPSAPKRTRVPTQYRPAVNIGLRAHARVHSDPGGVGAGVGCVFLPM
jgi:hypothetical protein